MFSYEVRGSVSKATPAFRVACTEAMTYITNTTLKTSMEAPETMFGFRRTFGREGLHKRDRPIVNIIHKTSDTCESVYVNDESGRSAGSKLDWNLRVYEG